MVAQENGSYFGFTTPKQIHVAMTKLEGILKKVALDSGISLQLATQMKTWFDEHKEVLLHRPFSDLAKILKEALAYNILDLEEQKDLLWFCQKFKSTGHYYDEITPDIYILSNLLESTLADGDISKEILEKLKGWLNSHPHFKRYWPFDEIDSLIMYVLGEGKIDEKEHKMLQDFFSSFFIFSSKGTEIRRLADNTKTVKGACAEYPEIEFSNRTFCFTGSLESVPREQKKQKVDTHGGQVHPNLRQDTNYLVVGAESSECWSYAYYGSKVEKALNWQKKGANLLIVHETDFWNACKETQ